MNQNKSITKNKKIVLTTLSAFFALVFFIIAFALINVNKANAQVELKEQITFNDSYVIGQTLNIPDATITVNGTECETYKVVYYPNGKVYKTDSAVLKDNGTYKVEYRAEYQNKLYTKSFTFNAEQKLFTTTNARSTAEYGIDLNVENYPDNLRSGIPGINVALKKGDTFNYNQAIDLSDNNGIQPLLTFMYNPSLGPKHFDAYYTYFVLTDAYNPDNSVTIRIYNLNYSFANWQEDAYAYRRDAKERIYVAANASGQGMKSVAGSFVSSGQNEAGCTIKAYNWLMIPDGSKPYEENTNVFGEESSVSLYYDYSTHRIYVSSYIAMPTLVVDLDEMTYQDAPFNGFTTGEVFVSMYGGGYEQPTMNTVITYIDGEALDAEFSDASKVLFDVDKSAYGSDEIVAAIDKPFKIFDATAIDMYHKDVDLKVKTRVYRTNHLGESKYDLPITDGYFTPTEAGNYTIEYVVKGFNGKTFSQYVSLTAKSVSEELTLNTEEQETGVSGKKIKVFDFEAVDALGKCNYNYVVLDPNSNEVEVIDGYFLPTTSGEYTVKLFASDYVGRIGETEKTLTVTDGGIVLTETPALNDIYFTNKNYALPIVNAYDYTTGQAASVTIAVDDVPVSDGVAKFNNEGSSIIKYLSGSKLLYEKTVTVIDAFYEDVDFGYQYSQEKYFFTEGLAVESQDDMITFSAISATENANLTFANTLLADDFNIIFAFFDQATISGIDKINLYLTDSIDKTQQLKISFVGNNTGTYPLYINDNVYPYQNAKLYPTTQGVYKLGVSYNNNLNTLEVDDCFIRDLNLLGYDDVFSGFSSRLINIKVELEGVSEGFKFGVYNICDQSLTKEKFDFVAPKMMIEGNYSSFVENGQTIEVFKASGIDVLSGKGTATVEVISPSNVRVTAEGGVKLNKVVANGYKIKITEYGIYTIIYRAYDDSGIGVTKYVTMVSIDREAPTFEVDFNKKTATLNETITIPNGTVSDNAGDENAKLCCIVINPMGYKVTYNQGDKVVLDKLGTYTFRFYAVDLSGNSSTLDFSVVVK